MKKNKTWVIVGGIAGAALLIIMAFAGWWLGIIGAIILVILARFIWGPSDSASIIGIDHRDRPRSSSYGGGFSPGGLFGVSGLGGHFGVQSTSLADSSPEAYLQGRGSQYVMENRTTLSHRQRRELAAAIKQAEARTGHQILAVIGALDENPAARADRVAAEWPTASLVVCIDTARKLFELRWHDASFALDAEQLATFTEMIRRSEFAAAIALLANVLPVQTAGAELPDIIEE